MTQVGSRRSTTPESPGPGVDIDGKAVIDPTKNVLDLVSAAITRQDDLRRQEGNALREVIGLRAEMALRQNQHDKELRTAEAARIDAIRSIDVGAVNRAAEVATAQAATLATQVAVSAETLRTQVAATATAGTVGLAAALEPIQKDIADLRRAQYEAQGQKTQIVETRSSAASSGMWIGLVLSASALMSAGFLGAAGIAITLLLR